MNLARDAATATDWTGGYQVTSAPAIANDLVIVGSSIADNWKVDAGRGIVRAFDARTGKLRWTWNPIPWAEKTTPRTGGANAWSTLSVDPEHDLVFIPTGSASPDYYGGIRKGDNKWANSVVALRASTGKFVWGFQVVHHDLWDYDVASQPTLFTWKDGTPAVVINTKMGHVFVLNRLTGAPLLPVEERPVPQTDIPGEQSSPTQPFSTISLGPEKFTASDAWGPTPADVKWCQDKIKELRSEGVFTPPSLKGTIVYPGNVGGVNWGSAAYDPQRHVMVANTNRLVAWVKLIPATPMRPRPKRIRTTASSVNSEISREPPTGSIAASSFSQQDALQRAAMGDHSGRRSVFRQESLGCSARLADSRAADRHDQSRRPDRHRRRTRLHLRRDGPRSCARSISKPARNSGSINSPRAVRRLP